MIEPIIIPAGISPELLQWYTDPEAGYWSPLLPYTNKSIIDAGRIYTLIQAEAVATEITGGSSAPDIDIEEATEVDMLADTQKAYRTKAIRGNITAFGILTATTLASTIPFVHISDAIDETWRLPAVAKVVDVAYDVAIREYRTGITPFLNRYYLRKHTPLIPETYRLALAAAKGIDMPIDYEEAMKESGLSTEWAEVWKQESFLYPALETALALLRRGEITAAEFDVWMQRSAVPDDARAEIVKLAEVIPPLPDLIRFAVREAFGEHTFEEQYPTYESIAAKMGLTKEAAGWYWYAHWDRIDLARMYDNLHRGLWTEEKFRAMLRIKDIHPDDHDAIVDVAFEPPSIREMGYGYDVGAYTEEDITKYRKWGGLSPEDATKAAAALVDYRLEAEREALRREWMHLYAIDKLTEQQFRVNLASVFDMKDRADLWVARGDLERERKLKPEPDVEYRIVPSSEAKWAYVNGLRSEEWYRDKLAALDWEEERITVAIERANLEMKPKPEEEIPAEYRTLTFGQIQDLYEYQKIPAEELPASFEKLGYAPEDAVNLAQILITVRARELEPKQITETDIVRFYDMGLLTEKELPAEYMKQGYSGYDAERKALWAKVSVIFPDLKAMYSKGWITADVLLQELKLTGLPEERAIELAMTAVKVEQPARLEDERKLTKAEIIKGVKAEIISADQAVSLLMDINYEEWEAWYILAIEKVVSVGDPEGYWDMKKVTEAYKKALGQKSKKIPDDLLIWEQRVKMLRAELKKLQDEEAPEEKIAEKAVQVNEAEANYRRLMIDWERLEP